MRENTGGGECKIYCRFGTGSMAQVIKCLLISRKA
jgi:hypothetical protein